MIDNLRIKFILNETIILMKDVIKKKYIGVLNHID